MSLFRKIFGGKSPGSEEKVPNEERSKYMPDVKLPVDERFTINFKANGGKFLYCENIEEVYNSLENIISENSWEDKTAYDETAKKLLVAFEENYQLNHAEDVVEVSLA